jgi:hypothetical protein
MPYPNKFLEEGLTYKDVLLMHAYSDLNIKESHPLDVVICRKEPNDFR